MPMVPTVKEATGTALDLTAWFAITLPVGVPPATAARLRDAIHAAVTAPRFAQALAVAGYLAASSTPEQLTKLVQDDSRAWRDQIRKLAITAN